MGRDVSSSQLADAAEARYLLFLVRAGEILGLSLDYHETLRNVCASAVETVADICLLYLGHGNDVELVGAAHRNPGMAERLAQAAAFVKGNQGYPRHVVCDVIDSATPVLVKELDDAHITRSATSPAHARFMREMGFCSVIVVPVVSQVQGILGALSLIRTEQSKERYDERALLFAEDLGRRCGVAISKSKLYSQSVEVATRLQLASLPRTLPVREDIKFDAYYEPAESELLIGGDWYDAFNLPDGRIGISIGDVTGHGVEAAAFMGSLRDALRTAMYGDANLVRALDIADYLIAEEFPEERYATALLNIFDPQTKELQSAAAGHPGPLMWLPSKREVLDPFRERGLPLGMRRAGRLKQKVESIVLEPGALAVYFTDGLVEWNREPLAGEEALRRALLREDIREALHPANALRKEIVRGKHQDDIAVLTLRVQNP
jgi:hypothetical protein